MLSSETSVDGLGFALTAAEYLLAESMYRQLTLNLEFYGGFPYKTEESARGCQYVSMCTVFTGLLKKPGRFNRPRFRSDG